MTILQAGGSLHDWGGIERYVLYLAEGLGARGHRSVVACPPGSPLAMRVGDRAVPLSFRSRYSPLAVARLLRLVCGLRPDVLHAHFSPEYRVAGLAGRLGRVPKVVLTRHVALKWSPRRVRGILALYDHIIATSEATRNELSASGVPESRMTVAMAGMPALVAGGSRMDTRRGLGHGESDFAVGFFGRLVAEKGVHVLMGAAYQLPDVRFEIFGDGPSRRSLEAGAAMAGLAGVRLRGYVSDVAEAMAAMDAIAIPSVWVEAFGYSALEAMSLGVPVVASRRGGLAEIIEHERTGLLFEPGDAGALAAAISRLREDPAFRDSLGAAGAEAQRAEYSVEKMAERVEAVYLKLSPARRLHS